MNLARWTDRFLLHSRGFFPARWRLPLRLRVYLTDSGAEPELKYLHRLCRRFRTAVDVGANHGCYAYRMTQFFEQVYAFEANARADFDLWHVRCARLQVFPYGLSDRCEETVLHLPIYRGRPLVGWASSIERHVPFAEGFAEVPARLECLDDQPFVRQRAIDLIKIDVEGAELAVLKGGRRVVERDKPVLIVEDNPDNRAALRTWLEALGYRSFSVGELVGEEMPSPNLVWMADTRTG